MRETEWTSTRDREKLERLLTVILMVFMMIQILLQNCSKPVTVCKVHRNKIKASDPVVKDLINNKLTNKYYKKRKQKLTSR